MDIAPNPSTFISQFLFMALLGLAAFGFWLWMLVDCITKEPADGQDRIVWILVIVLLHTLGALVYLLARRPTRMQMYGQ